MYYDLLLLSSSANETISLDSIFSLNFLPLSYINPDGSGISSLMNT